MSDICSVLRELIDSPFYFSGTFDKTHALIDMIMMATHEDGGIVTVRGIVVPIKKGQLAHSIENLSKRWKWSIGKTNRYLKVLKSSGQIDYQSDNLTTLITILNYDKYIFTSGQTNGQPIQQTAILTKPLGK